VSADNPPRPADHPQSGRIKPDEAKLADRLWAYSDAVFAVIVTIMVLQLRPPSSHHFSALLGLWPTVISYVASYVFIAIIWINYHHLTRFVQSPSLGLPDAGGLRRQAGSLEEFARPGGDQWGEVE
jgi:Endosomal/lysosomal potassium channel TMEM175